MRYFAIIFLLIAFLGSCSAQTIRDTGKFTKEIPIWRKGDTDLFYKLTQQKVKQLSLNLLTNGYDSLEIRIWYDYSLMNGRDLLIIKRTNSKWIATKYSMKVDWDAGSETETILTKKIDTLTPKNGWNSFLEKLFTMQITTLPDMLSIPGLFDGWTDGVDYDVEIATKNQYRFYSYHLPDKFQDKYWQAKNMVNILKLVEKEFGIKCGIK